MPVDAVDIPQGLVGPGGAALYETDLFRPTYRPMQGDERVDQVRGMRANTGASKVYFWGQEMVIARRARDADMPLDHEALGLIVADLGLPLIGPELSDYPERIARAAGKWLQDG